MKYSNVISVENVSGYSIPELLHLLLNTQKEQGEQLDNLNSNIQNEIAKCLNQWYQDGTLSDIIQTQVLTDIDNQLNQISWNFTKFGGNPSARCNSDSLQALVNQVHEIGGGIIHVPHGTYYFEKPVIWKSNVSLTGDGIGATILKTRGGSEDHLIQGFSLIYTEEYGGDVDIQDIEPIQNCSFTNFTINGAEVHMNPSYRGKGIFFQKVYNCVFSRIRFEETGSTALGVDMLHHCVINDISCYKCGRCYNIEYNPQGCAGIGIGTNGLPVENLVISNCYTEECGQFGIFIENQAIFGQTGGNPKGVIIENCITIKGKNHGIGVKGGRNISVNNCMSYENNGYGVIIDYNTRLTKITNNTITENALGGVAVLNDYYFYNITIDNNYIYANQGHGIDLIPNHTSTKTVSDILIQNNQIYENTGCGIKINNHTDKINNLVIKNNECFKNGEHGTYLASITRGLCFDSNHIYYNGQLAPNTYSGALFECDITYGVITNNNVYNMSDTDGQAYGFAFISRGGVQKKFVRTIMKSNYAKYHTQDLICDYETGELDYKDNDFTIIPKGKISIGDGRLAILPKESFSFSNIGTNTLAIKFKYTEHNRFQPIMSSFDNQSTGTQPKGWALVLTGSNQPKLLARENSGAEEISVLFNTTLVPNQIYEIRLEFTSSELSCKLSTNGSQITLTSTVSGSLTTILNLLIGFNCDKLIGGHYQGAYGVIISGAIVVYDVSTFSNCCNSKYLFNNIGANKEIIDTKSSLKGYAFNNAIQYFDI